MSLVGISHNLKYPRSTIAGISIQEPEEKWQNQYLLECPNSGIKNYAEFIKEKDGFIITDKKERIDSKLVYVKTKKQTLT